MTDDTPPDRPPEEGQNADDSTVRRASLSVPDMDCASCANKVEGSVEGVEGVEAIDPRPTTGDLVVEYDPSQTDEAEVAAAVEGAGYTVADGGASEATFDVPDMDCASCANKVESGLARAQGVIGYETRPATGTVIVEFDQSTTAADVAGAIKGAGYEVTGHSGDDGATTPATGGSLWTSSRALRIWVSAILLAGGLTLEWLVAGFDTAVVTLGPAELLPADVFFLGAIAVGGVGILRGGYYSAKGLNLDIDFLMSAAILSAITASVVAGERLYFEGATLAVLFSVAELLETYSMDRARNSLEELMELSPDEATVLRDGEEVTVPADEIAVGDVVVVKPGEKVPTDGTVRDGESAIDESPITGESVPVDKTPGDEVYAGTVNEGGYLEIEATSRADDTTLSRIVTMVEDAQSNKTEREQFVDRFAGYYTPFMVAVALLVAIVPPLALGAPWVEWFVAGITMLVLACPCAFVISTPVSVVSGITSAAKNGVLIKGGDHLEAMGNVDAIAMDKTGTLTKGELSVTDVVPVNGHDEDDVLRCARGLEARSEHPIGEAIVAHADGAAVERREVSDFQSITGKGVEASLDGMRHFAGKPGLFEDLGFDLSHTHVVDDHGQLGTEVRDLCDRHGCLNLVEDTIPRLQSEGKTVVLVGREDELEGVIAVADEIRPDAAWMVERLQAQGVETVMLTGDNERTAAAVAAEVGIDEYRAGLLPEDKVDAVEALREEYEGGVAMVGDGINDAPALATATVGVAMGAAGTETALETADIALMGDDLSRLPYLLELSDSANGVIRQNIWASLGLKALLAVGVPLGYVSVALAVLAGDAGMTVGVTGNAMRLSGIEPETPE
jgi:Cd2+/Zn2+-exporting ATPase